MLYDSFYEKASARGRTFICSGYEDAAVINWLVKYVLGIAHGCRLLFLTASSAGMNDADFGFPMRSGYIHWWSAEKFIQAWNANPIQQPDGTWHRDPKGVHILLRLRPEQACRYLEKLRADMQSSLNPQAYTSSPASLLSRLQGSSPNLIKKERGPASKPRL